MSALINFNIMFLFRCWNERLSGMIRMVPTADLSPMSSVVPLVEGGIKDRDAWELLAGGLDAHVYSLDERPMLSAGDRRLMGALIAHVCRRNDLDQAKILAAGDPSGEVGRKPMLMPAITLPPFFLAEERSDRAEDHALESLCASGRQLLETGDYAEADRELSGARDLRMDYAPALALLAMARFQNPERPQDERRRDAEAMAKMAYLLDAEHADVKRAHELVLIGRPSRESEQRGQSAAYGSRRA